MITSVAVRIAEGGSKGGGPGVGGSLGVRLLGSHAGFACHVRLLGAHSGFGCRVHLPDTSVITKISLWPQRNLFVAEENTVF